MTSSFDENPSNTISGKVLPILNQLQIFEGGFDYLNCQRLYYTLFSKIPCFKIVEDIDCRALRLWIEEELGELIVDRFYMQNYNDDKKKMVYQDLFLVFKDELLVELTGYKVMVLFSNNNEQQAQQLIDRFIKFIERPKREYRIHMVVTTNRGLDTASLEIKKPVVDLSLHYNEDLQPFHKTLITELKKKKTSGLFLFHGKPGTGKSTYIRYLVHQTNNRVIFISPKVAGSLDVPQFSLFLIQNQNSVFVIEDAEELIVSRENGHNSYISMLLNLTDGLLGEALGVKVIATFNTQVSNLDSALLRKGRLKGMHEFKELSTERANGLLQKLGKTISVSKPTTLADIYNITEQEIKYGVERRKIGFVTS